MGRLDRSAVNPSLGTPVQGVPSVGLPARYTPKVAGYAGGPFLDPVEVTPSAWRWMNTRTYIVRHTDGLDYRAVRVTNEYTREFAGYWAVELLGTPLPIEVERVEK